MNQALLIASGAALLVVKTRLQRGHCLDERAAGRRESIAFASAKVRIFKERPQKTALSDAFNSIIREFLSE
jgi:hypothetical protein